MKLEVLKTLAILIILVFNVNLKSAYSQKNLDLEKGLLVYYSFEDKATDLSGNNNDGILHNVNRERDVDGTKRGSYRWNDDNDYIEIPVDMNIGALPQVTLCAWVYPLSYRDEIIVISNDDRGGDRKIYTAKSNNKWIWAVSDGKGGFIGKVPKVSKQWVFLVATYNEDTRTGSIYVDGVKTSGKTKMDMGSPKTLIGASPRGNDDFEALIDEVRIYDRILTDTEIDSLQKMKPFIDNFEDKDDEKTYFYLVKQDNLIVRSQPTTDAASIGTLNTSDTLYFDERVPTKGGKYDEWLKIKINDKTGYVQLKYLNHTSLEEETRSAFEKKLDKYMSWGKWQFWLIMVVMLILGLTGSFMFKGIDSLLNTITRNDYEGNVAFFPLTAALTAFVMAILMIIWQDNIEYYLGENFTIWPYGYGFSAWAVWLLLLVNAVAFLIMFIESLTCGNLIHGLLRIIIQSFLAVITFISVLVITIAIIIIMIVLFVALLLISAMLVRTVRRG
ncbi:MAG: SH3 domain-containing protein [Bacteroidetes bacterium]|nr:SH3 domain-containing protein [Bacteroidota bacterium]